MLIAVDVDGTVANLMDVWLSRYNRDYNDNLRFEQITEWDVSKFVKPECGERIYSYLDDPTIYNDVSPIEGAVDGVNSLRLAGHRVVFVTAGGEASKYEWLLKYGFLDNRKDYVRCVDKSLIRADVLVDDGPHNLAVFHGGRILLRNPANGNEWVRGAWIACNWGEVSQIVQDLLS